MEKSFMKIFHVVFHDISSFQGMIFARLELGAFSAKEVVSVLAHRIIPVIRPLFHITLQAILNIAISGFPFVPVEVLWQFSGVVN
jgi:hypothetical protein